MPARRIVRRAWRIARRIALIALAVIGVLIVTAMILVHTDWGRNKIRGAVVSAMADVFPCGVAIGSLEGSVLGDLVVHDVTLRDCTGLDAVAIKRVELNVALGSVFDKTIRLEYLRVFGVAIQAVVPAGGQLNLLEMIHLSPEPLGWAVALDDVRVHDAAIAADIEGRVAHLDAIAIDGTVGYGRDESVTTELKLTGTWREQATDVSLGGEVRIADGVITAKKLDAAGAGITMTSAELRYAGPSDAAGTVTVDVARGASQRFFPDSPAMPELHVVVGLARGDDHRHLAVAITGTLGTAKWWPHRPSTTVSGQLAVRPDGGPQIGGLITVSGANAQTFAPTAVPSNVTANVVLGLTLDRDATGARAATVSGLVAVSGRGTVGDLDFERLDAHALIVDSKVFAGVHAVAGGTNAVISASLTREPAGAISIDRSHVVAHVDDIGAVVPYAQARGAVDIDVDVTGRLSDQPAELTVDGTVAGRRLRRGRIAIARADLRLRRAHFDLAQPKHPRGGATLVVTGATIGDSAVPTVTVAAASRDAGGYAVTAQSGGDHLGPGGAPWTVDLDAVVHPGAGFRSATIELGDYSLRTDGVPWSGHGGTIVASPDKIVVDKVAGKVDRGSFAVDGSIVLRGGPIDGTVTLTKVDLAHLDRALDLKARGLGPLAGEADLTAELHHKRGRITGTITGAVRGLVFREGGDPLDATIDAAIEPARIAGTVSLEGRAAGNATLVLDVEPPGDPTDLAAWARLERRAVRSATLHAVDLDLVALARLAGVPPPFEGMISTDLTLTATDSVGEIHARDLVVPRVPGMLDVDATLDLADPGVVVAKATATLREIGRAAIDVTVRVPTRPFDVRAWRALDVTALKGATIAVDEVTIDDKLAARFRLRSLRGRVGASIEVAEAMAGVHGRIAARQITGGPLAHPVDVVIDVMVDANGGHAEVTGSVDGVAIMTGTASAPFDPAILAERGLDVLKTVAITGAGTIAPTKLATVLRTFGEDRNVQGTLHGEAHLTGTLSAPVATTTIVIEDFGGRRSKVKRLALDAKYAGGVITATLDGAQEAGGTLHATAKIDLAHLETTAIELKSHQFQISPVLRLIPNVVGLRGVVDADIRITGIDPEVATADGVIKIRDAQVPVTDAVGAITKGQVDLTFRPGHAVLAVRGAIESGEIEISAEADLDGLLPRDGSLDISVRDIALISTMQPRFASSLHADLKLVGDHWQITARLTDTRVVIPDEEGKPLHQATPPTDMVFSENGQVKMPARKAMMNWLGQRPSHPFARIALRIDPISIESKQLRGEVSGQLDIAIGDDGISIDGQIEARRGEVMVFERRYLLARAALVFDGGIDPLVDIQMSHDFADLAMNVGIKGRLSDPELELTSEPSSYTEGQLLGFLLGGSPGGPGQDSKDALTGAAAAVASQTVGGFVTRKLPVKIDVLRFEPATSSSSAAFAVGKWVTGKLLVLIRSRIEPREDENRSETELEYWLGRRVLLDAVGGDRGVLGLDLLWTRRW